MEGKYAEIIFKNESYLKFLRYRPTFWLHAMRLKFGFTIHVILLEKKENRAKILFQDFKFVLVNAFFKYDQWLTRGEVKGEYHA